MKILVWHWGRRGAGPLFAARLAEALRELPGCSVRLSLAAGAEILAGAKPPECDWREPTYESALGFAMQRLAGPFMGGRTRRHLTQDLPDVAICAMPALLDLRMVSALRHARIAYGVIVHDAEAHPGDALKFRILGQRRLLRDARYLFTLTSHVQIGLQRQGFGGHGQSLSKLWLPAIDFTAAPPAPRQSGRPRILYFGRLLPYKGLDLLAEAIERIGPNRPFDLRVSGDGPNSRGLERLKSIPGVTVERRWFGDDELPGLLAWADALVLPYREASQSGVAAVALAAGLHVLATNVGGLPEQLGGLPNTTLCDPSALAIADSLLQLAAKLSAPDRAASIARVDSQADWRAMAAAMRDKLHETAPNKRESEAG